MFGLIARELQRDKRAIREFEQSGGRSEILKLGKELEGSGRSLLVALRHHLPCAVQQTAVAPEMLFDEERPAVGDSLVPALAIG